MIKLIALLGNFGKQYSGTRHNAAWIFAESLSVYSSLNWQKKFKGQFATESTSEGLIYYLKPSRNLYYIHGIHGNPHYDIPNLCPNHQYNPDAV